MRVKTMGFAERHDSSGLRSAPHRLRRIDRAIRAPASAAPQATLAPARISRHTWHTSTIRNLPVGPRFRALRRIDRDPGACIVCAAGDARACAHPAARMAHDHDPKRTRQPAVSRAQKKTRRGKPRRVFVRDTASAASRYGAAYLTGQYTSNLPSAGSKLSSMPAFHASYGRSVVV
ncbi:hypothetical protein [Lysobacter capsici]|uniref:hypothetical protein n=1 Tax=Lysobacter capsici TaxID=435897 RepID=UPI001C0008F5|nr:hypothetical protein [Lysobacter capsici]QWF15469.1 hypothetical protein KME82_16975 [Lysobacter capsici]